MLKKLLCILSILMLVISNPIMVKNVYADENEDSPIVEVEEPPVVSEEPEEPIEEPPVVVEEPEPVVIEEPIVVEEPVIEEEEPVVEEEPEVEDGISLPDKDFKDHAEVVDEMIEVEVDNRKEEEVEAVKVSYKVTIYFTDILLPDGTSTSSSVSNTLSSGVGWSFTQKKLDNLVNPKQFTFNGDKYEYTGSWVYSDGSPVSTPLSFSGSQLTGDLDVYIRPVYNIIRCNRLYFNYINNISDGTGYWSNKDSFTGYTHTFSEPTEVEHYQFLYWKDSSSGSTYGPGDSYSIENISSDVTVYIYAYYQPSVTVVYHDYDGSVLNTVESFSGINLYDYVADKEGCTFAGWSDGGEILGDTAYSAPEITYVKVDQLIYDVYANYDTTYDVEYYLETLDGDYKMEESHRFTDRLGNTVEAELKEYDGFTRTDTEDTLLQDVLKVGTVLKVFYLRNTYTITWVDYNGEVLELDEGVKHGAMPSYDSANPTRKKDSKYTYKFTVFEPELVEVTEDKTYTATYKRTAIPDDPVNPPYEPDEPDNPEPPVVPDVPEDPEPTVEEPVIEDIQVIDDKVPTTTYEPTSEPEVGYWALFNLLCMIVTFISTLVKSIFYRREREEEEDEEKKEYKYSALPILTSLVLSVCSCILFVITEDMTLKMRVFDKYSIVMLLILIVGVLLLFIDKRKEKQKE